MTEAEVSILFPKTTISQTLAVAIARMLGWRLDMAIPVPSRCVMIGAPHTSNSDLFIALLLMMGGGINLNWVGKDTLFRFPMGPIFRGLGGIPVNRRKSTNFVGQMVNLFAQSEVLRLVVAPSGTRKKTSYWRTGFYHIAVDAGVPIVFAYGDYKRKMVGVGAQMTPSGDIKADFEIIRQFYANIQGKYPDLQSDIRIRGK